MQASKIPFSKQCVCVRTAYLYSSLCSSLLWCGELPSSVTQYYYAAAEIVVTCSGPPISTFRRLAGDAWLLSSWNPERSCHLPLTSAGFFNIKYVQDLLTNIYYYHQERRYFPSLHQIHLFIKWLLILYYYNITIFYFYTTLETMWCLF